MRITRIFTVLLLSFFLYACSENEKEVKVSSDDSKIKEKELELKQKELELKEKELELQKQKPNLDGQSQGNDQSRSQNQNQVQEPPPQAPPQQQQAPPNPPPNQRKPNYNNGYVAGDYPEGTTRYLTYNDLSYKSKYQLKIMRNEIYARHGYIFQKSQDMWSHFNSKSWYSPRYYNVDGMLSKVEQYNINYIKQFE